MTHPPPRIGIAGAIAATLFGLLSCAKAADPNPPEFAVQYIGSTSCQKCHERFYGLWAGSRHGLAMQSFTRELARTEIAPLDPGLEIGDSIYRVLLDDGGGSVLAEEPEGRSSYPIEYALGGKNVYYFLTSLPQGRLQVLPVAFDVKSWEWFDTAASAIRHLPEGTDEALDWRHPAYTFNTSCFGCHVSQVSTNYEPETGTYRTTWTEPGINCETCHGPASDHVRVCGEASAGAVPEDLKIILTKGFTVEQTNDLCAPCHAKAMPLSGRFLPGDRFFDHFDLMTLEHQDFYPDGRDLGENYTQTTWLMSPCARSGELDCVHCHTSSGRFRQKDDPDEACLPCHRERVMDPAEHTHHAAKTPGGRCVDCHMPATWFARMGRHDHSMRPPRPAATLAFQSPNACNICHSGQSAEWANRWVVDWHGPASQDLYLEPAMLVDAGRRRDWKRIDEMLAYLGAEGSDPVFATSLIRLLRACPDDRKWEVLLSSIDNPSPLVRASAAEALGDQLTPESVRALLGATRDGFRLVRIRAAAALAGVPGHRVDESSRKPLERATEEFVASMRARPDDAFSHFNLGNFYLNRGEPRRALNSFEMAVDLRPDLVQPRVNLANLYAALGRKRDAENALRRALDLESENAAAHFNLGLLLGEQGRLREAADSHQAALQADPELAAAAYNLCVILSGENPQEGLPWCRRSAELRSDQPKYAYTVAYFLLEAGNHEQAITVLEDLIRRHPGYADAWLMLGSIYERDRRVDEARNLYRRAMENTALPLALRQQLARKTRD